MVNVGGIVSVGGGVGGGGGSTSGITSINAETGPAIVINGTNGIGVLTSSNIITIDGASLSGLISPDGSGINAINGDTGPNIDFVGVNGITFTNPSPGVILGDVSAVSGLILPSGGIGGVNGQIGPHLELQGANGAVVTVIGENSLVVDVSSLSGIIPDPDGSGINAINGDLGPNIDLIGVNGITVTPIGGGNVLIDGVAVSGIDSIEGLTQPDIDLLAVGALFAITTPDASTIGFDLTALSGIIPVTSGVESVNEQSGPHITHVGVNGIEITAAGNEVLHNGIALSGIFSIETLTAPDIDLFAVGNLFDITTTGADRIDFDISALSGIIPLTSGIESVNLQQGPHLNIVGVNGVEISAAANEILIDGAGASGAGGGGGGVTSLSVIGDTDLTGDIDLGSPPSGFIVIEDSSDASPLLFSVDVMGLSGLWGFPANGFPTGSARCYAETFTSAFSWVVTHNLNTEDVIVSVYDDSSPRCQLFPDILSLTDANTVTITFNSQQAGRVVVMGCS